MLTCGIDIGSRTIEIVIYESETAKILECCITDTGSTPTDNVQIHLNSLMEPLGIEYEDLTNTVVTGYGRKSFPLPGKIVTEITCHARGIAHLYPDAKTVIDIGGQDSKVIGLESDGRVRDFAMNDRCAAGTGRFLEMASEILEVPLEKMGSIAIAAKKRVEINSMCTVFAESEIVGLISKGHPKDEILLGVMESVTKRIVGLTGRVGIQESVVLTGGVAKNIGVVRTLEQEIGTRLIIPEQPQITGALGAALLAVE